MALTAGWYQTMSDHYTRFLEDADASDHMDIEALPRLPYAVHVSRWIYVQACLNLDQFFDTLKTHLLQEYPFATNLSSVIDYQQQLVITPTFDRNIGKTFRTDFNWVKYFQEARARAGSEALAKPIAVPGAVVHASDGMSGEWSDTAGEGGSNGYYGKPLEWASGDMEDRWATWINRTVVGRSSAAMQNLHQLRITDTCPAV